MTARFTAIALLALLCPLVVTGQTRSMQQDPALNNLQHAPGVTTAASGTLGEVRKAGSGPRRMLLIPGIGFGAGVWSEFMERHKDDATMWAVTLPGFGGTPPLSMPQDERFSEAPWTLSTMQALVKLLDEERIEKVTLVAHWALATQIALQLAIDHPDRVEAVILVGGVLKAYYDVNPEMMTWSAPQRSAFVEGMGQRWFKTVTRRTWDDNNYMSYDYSVNPLLGLFLWREAQAPSLPVWVRYLLEFYSFDQTQQLSRMRVPTLVVHPDFDDPAFYVDSGRNYMRNLCVDSWRGARELNDRIAFETIPQSRLFIMHDQPASLDGAIARFLQAQEGEKRPGAAP